MGRTNKDDKYKKFNKFQRNQLLNETRNDNSARFGTKVEQTHKPKKFDWRKELNDVSQD